MVVFIQELIAEGQLMEEIVKSCDIACQSLPVPYSRDCSRIIAANVRAIIAWIEQGVPDVDICAKFSLCNRAVARRAPVPPRYGGDIPVGYTEEEYNGLKCSICTKVMSFVEGLLLDTKIQSSIAKMTEELCKKEDQAFLRELCMYIVDNYIPKLIQWLESGLEKLDFCVRIGYCKQSKFASGHHHSAPLRPRVHVNSIAEENVDKCSVCHTVVGWTSNLMKKGSIGAGVASRVLAQSCQGQVVIAALCKAIVSQFVPQIMDGLSRGLDAANVCRSIGLCAANEFYLSNYPSNVYEPYMNARVPMTAEENFDVCLTCKNVVGLVKTALRDGIQAAGSVRAYVQSACGRVGILSSACYTIVDNYIPAFIRWCQEAEDVDAEVICGRVNMCRAKGFENYDHLAGNWMTETLPRVPHMYNGYDFEANLDTCTTCKTVVNFIAGQMKKGSIGSTAITIAATGLCDAGVVVAAVCNVLVSQFVPQIMDLLGQGLNTLDLCTRIGFCAKNSGFIPGLFPPSGLPVLPQPPVPLPGLPQPPVPLPGLPRLPFEALY